jgi:hypothetical protein
MMSPLETNQQSVTQARNSMCQVCMIVNTPQELFVTCSYALNSALVEWKHNRIIEITYTVLSRERMYSIY